MTILKLHREPLIDDWLDAYGHLNEAYYLLPFSNATWAMQAHFEIGVRYFQESGCAIYTVESHLRYLNEVRQPAVMEIESMVLGVDPKKLWWGHQMLVAGKVCATWEGMMLHYNTRESRTMALPDSVYEKLLAAQLKPLPDWAGRQISLSKNNS